jgi:hypothetical protein
MREILRTYTSSNRLGGWTRLRFENYLPMFRSKGNPEAGHWLIDSNHA